MEQLKLNEFQIESYFRIKKEIDRVRNERNLIKKDSFRWNDLSECSISSIDILNLFSSED